MTCNKNYSEVNKASQERYYFQNPQVNGNALRICRKKKIQITYNALLLSGFYNWCPNAEYAKEKTVDIGSRIFLVRLRNERLSILW